MQHSVYDRYRNSSLDKGRDIGRVWKRHGEDGEGMHAVKEIPRTGSGPGDGFVENRCPDPMGSLFPHHVCVCVAQRHLCETTIRKGKKGKRGRSTMHAMLIKFANAHPTVLHFLC